MNNHVAKHARTFNKAHVFNDRTKFKRDNQIDLDEWYHANEEDDFPVEEKE